MVTYISELLRALGVGSIVAVALAVLSYYVGEFYPETKPITLVLTAFLTVNIVYLDLLRRRFAEKNRLSLPERKINRSLRRIPDVWRKRFADELVRDTAEVVEKLGSPNEQYYGEEALYHALTAEVRKLKEGDSVFAVCADKTWDASFVQDYLEANVERARAGVRIRRIFYEFSGRVMDAARAQAASGISAAVLRASSMSNLPPTSRIPADYGIAIFGDRTVILHAGVGSKARASRYDSPGLARLIRDRFSVVERLAEEVSVKPSQELAPERHVARKTGHKS